MKDAPKWWKLSAGLIAIIFALLIWTPFVLPDPIRHVQGIAGKNPNDDLTWGHLMAMRAVDRAMSVTFLDGANTISKEFLLANAPVYCVTELDSSRCASYASHFMNVADELLIGDNSQQLRSLPVRAMNYGMTWQADGALVCTTIEVNGCFSPISIGDPDMVGGGPLNTFLGGLQNIRIMGCSNEAFEGTVGGDSARCIQTNNSADTITQSHPSTPITDRFQSHFTGAANTAVTITIPADVRRRAFISHIEARCSAGTSQITVRNVAGSTMWSTDTGEVGNTANFFRHFPIALSGAFLNQAVEIVLDPCGVGNTGTLMAGGGNL